jgi:hypothetical protein
MTSGDHIPRQASDDYTAALDEIRRRVHNETCGHRGHKHDPPVSGAKRPIASMLPPALLSKVSSRISCAKDAETAEAFADSHRRGARFQPIWSRQSWVGENPTSFFALLFAKKVSWVPISVRRGTPA